MTSSKPVVILEKKGNIACITINRPEKRNALNNEVKNAMISIFEELKNDDSIKVVTTTGAGDVAFSAGSDLGELLYRHEHPDSTGPSISRYVESFPKITIAVVNGYCLGAGLSLLAVNDFAIASKEKAQFGLPEIMRDFVPRVAVARICQNTHLKWALEMLLTGKNWDAERAYHAGLINRVVPHSQLQEAAMEWAKEIAQWNIATLMYCKKAAYAVIDATTRKEGLDIGEFWHEEEAKTNPETSQGLRNFLSGKGVKANR